MGRPGGVHAVATRIGSFFMPCSRARTGGRLIVVPLLDLVLLAVIVAFFAGAALFVRGCAWILRQGQGSEERESPDDDVGEELEELPLNRDPGR